MAEAVPFDLDRLIAYLRANIDGLAGPRLCEKAETGDAPDSTGDELALESGINCFGVRDGSLRRG
jgi:hypothetical protein